MEGLQHLTSIGESNRVTGCSEMFTKSSIWLMVTALVAALAPAQFTCRHSDCACCNSPAGECGNTFPSVTAHRCCSSDRGNEAEPAGDHACSCEISVTAMAIDLTSKPSLDPDVPIEGIRAIDRVESRVIVPPAQKVEPIRKCSWQAFACVWRK